MGHFPTIFHFFGWKINQLSVLQEWFGRTQWVFVIYSLADEKSHRSIWIHVWTSFWFLKHPRRSKVGWFLSAKTCFLARLRGRYMLACLLVYFKRASAKPQDVKPEVQLAVAKKNIGSLGISWDDSDGFKTNMFVPKCPKRPLFEALGRTRRPWRSWQKRDRCRQS